IPFKCRKRLTMKWISRWLVNGLAGSMLAFGPPWAEAARPTSYHLAHPIGWMHSLPVGEAPGWSGSFWFQLELSHSNIWNAPIDLRNENTNQLLYYSADFEQTSAILEFGFPLTSYLAFSM